MTEEKIQELIKDFIAFQQETPITIEFNARVKYGTTDFKYADLGQMLKTIRPLLNKHNFGLMQVVSTEVNPITGNPYGVVRTIILHKSGENITSHIYYDINCKSQDQGAGITYAKRYALGSLVGVIAEEDTDGPQGGEKPKAKKPESRKTESKKPPVTKWIADQDNIEAFRVVIGKTMEASDIKSYRNAFDTKYKSTADQAKELEAIVHCRLEELNESTLRVT